MTTELTESESIELVKALSNPVLRKYLSILRSGAITDIALTPPSETRSLEVHYREVRFAQGNIHCLDTLLKIGAMKQD